MAEQNHTRPIGHIASLNAESARRVSGQNGISPEAAAAVLAARERAALIEERVADVSTQLRTSIDAAAEGGKYSAASEYSERIAPRQNNPERVAQIKDFAGAVVTQVVAEFVGRGFEVKTRSRDEQDVRDNVDAPPEYYVTTITANW